MPLILKVVSYKQGLPAEPTEARFDQTGGTIGRADENDLVLLDPEKCISRKHAELAYDGVNYSLTDKSLAGTFVDQSETPLKGETIQLHDGMRLNIGEYEVSVSIGESVPATPDVFDDDLYSSVCDTEVSPNLAPLADDAEELDILSGSDSVDPFADVVADVDPLELDPLLDADSLEPHSAPPAAHQGEQNGFADMDHVSPFNEHFRPPDVEPVLESAPPAGNDNLSLDDLFDDDVPREVSAGVAENAFPADSKQLSGQPATKTELKPTSGDAFEVPDQYLQPEKTSEPVPENSVRQTDRATQYHSYSENIDSDQLLETFLDGMGLSPKDIADIRSNKEAMQLAGTMVRGMTGGIMALLRGRAEMKSQVRLSMTMVRPMENNPLKFSASVDDALRAMLNPDRKGFLPALEAINNAVNDITNHQLALTAGTQAALADLVQRFDPQHFENPYKSGFSFGKKGKSWDNYAKQYKATSSRAIEEFFGDEFVRAYEEQMRKLELNRGN